MNEIPESSAIISKTLIQSSVPSDSKLILLYLLSRYFAENSEHLYIVENELNERLGLSKYAVQKARLWLQAKNYAFQKRLKTGHNLWIYFEAQQIETPPIKIFENLATLHPIANTTIISEYRYN